MTPRDRGGGLGLSALAALDSDARVVAAFAAALGLSVEQPFGCVLPGHSGEASIRRGRGGRFAYVCSCEGRDKRRIMVEVFAAARSGVLCRRGRSELARWKARILVEGGAVEAPEVELPPLPPSATDATLRVYDGLRLHLACCRLLGHDPDEPFTFTRRYACDWTGVSRDQARAAFRVLDEHVIAKVGEHVLPSGHAANLYGLRNQREGER